MSYALNEVSATAKRAARGAGYPWGLAEEAACATRWLCARGLDGTGALVQLLNQGLAKAPDRHIPKELATTWAGDEALCPLAAGALLSDNSGTLTTAQISLERVAVPLLLLPFAANAARGLSANVTVTADGTEAVTDGRHLSLSGAFPARANRVSVRLGGSLPAPLPLRTRADPDPDHWATLNRYAHRTYAPATEESRRLGAGAGLSDND